MMEGMIVGIIAGFNSGRIGKNKETIVGLSGTLLALRDGSPDYGPKIANIIDSIVSGLMGGDSQYSQKRTYRQVNPDHTNASFRLTKVITCGPNDPVSTASNNHEALMIEMLINNYIIKNVYVDPRSLVDVLYYWTLENLKLTGYQFAPIQTP